MSTVGNRQASLLERRERNMIDIKGRLVKNEEQLKGIQTRIQQLQQETQILLAELLRLEGERRILAELQEENNANAKGNVAEDA